MDANESGLKDALEYVVGLNDQQELFQEIFDNGDSMTIGVKDTIGAVTLYDFPKPPLDMKHRFQTLEGLVDFLSSNHAKDGGVVFVGEHSIIADYGYGGHTTKRATLRLEFSTEMQSLEKLMKGVQHKYLWQLLNAELDGYIDKSLALAVSQVRITGNTEQSVKIFDSGLSDESAQRHVSVVFADSQGKGEHTAELKTEWEWNGRVWECFEDITKIDLRLELMEEAVGDGKRKLIYKFYPRRLMQILRDSRQRLVDYLADSLKSKNFLVLEGSPE